MNGLSQTVIVDRGARVLRFGFVKLIEQAIDATAT
jgi:hypothetical protein